MDGIIVINKPAGYTSHDCIAIMRGITGIRKMGHTGTLDPNATGVLPVCIGKATKLREYMDTAAKTYVAGIRFGKVTKTQDIWGEDDESFFSETERKVVPSSSEEIEISLRSFEGEILQTPPSYSAVFVNGRRAYDIARSGEKPQIEPRIVTIYSVELLDYDPSVAEGHLKVRCGRGTYVRTICHDLGIKLGCGACLSSLTRTKACGFSLDEALDLEEARKMEASEVLKRILPVGRAIGDMQRLQLGEAQAKKYLNGMTLKHSPEAYLQKEPVAVFFGEELIGISEFEGNSLKPVKVFS